MVRLVKAFSLLYSVSNSISPSQSIGICLGVQRRGQTQEWLPDRGTSTCASRRYPPSVRTLAWFGLVRAGRCADSINYVTSMPNLTLSTLLTSIPLAQRWGLCFGSGHCDITPRQAYCAQPTPYTSCVCLAGVATQFSHGAVLCVAWHKDCWRLIVQCKAEDSCNIAYRLRW